MTPAHFTDARIHAVYEGEKLTDDERAFLIASLPEFEECDQTIHQLAEFSDSDLMLEAYWVWRDYSANQGML